LCSFTSLGPVESDAVSIYTHMALSLAHTQTHTHTHTHARTHTHTHTSEGQRKRLPVTSLSTAEMRFAASWPSRGNLRIEGVVICQERLLIAMLRTLPGKRAGASVRIMCVCE
jgi:hypothetical protein